MGETASKSLIEGGGNRKTNNDYLDLIRRKSFQEIRTLNENNDEFKNIT